MQKHKLYYQTIKVISSMFAKEILGIPMTKLQFNTYDDDIR